MANETIIVLDLEGTLISNAVSQFARPGLVQFLDFCKSRFETIYIYTAVSDARCHEIVFNLVSRELAPAWLSDVEFIQWDRQFKDLNNIPNTSPEACLILDDNRDYIVPDQISQWVPIEKFEPPYPATDQELERVEAEILRRIS